MRANTFVIKKYTAQTGLIECGARAPKDYFSFVFENDPSPEKLATFNTEEEALEALKLYNGQGGCVRCEGFSGSFYEVTVYAVECYEVDEEGEFVEGSDYIC